MSINKFPFEDNKAKIIVIKKNVAIKASNDAIVFFKKSFKDEGFTDESIVKWEKSKRAEKDGGKTLTDQGDLLRSIKSTLVTFPKSIIKTVGISYARRHNEGIRMPKRKFMGNSRKLTRDTGKMIQKAFLKTLIT